MSDTLNEHRAAWQKKPVLRRIYTDYYHRIASHCVDGKTLEVGGGTGNLKSFLPDIVATDIQHAAWLDVVADAHKLPFAPGAFANIVLFDVLHHLERPPLFFHEAARILRPGGRLVMLEPGITPISKLFYDNFHPEPVILSDDPYAEGGLTSGRDPYLSNQAIPELMFVRDRDRFATTFPEFRQIMARRLSLFAYPLSGGFRPWSLIPSFLVAPVLKVEDVLMPLAGSFAAFRLLVVLQRT